MRSLTCVLRVASCIALTTTLHACSGSTPDELPPERSPRGEPQGDPLDAHSGLQSALEAADVEAVASLLDPSAGLLIFHPRLGSRIDGITQAERGFERMFRALGSAEWTEVHTRVDGQDDVAWFTYHFAIESPSVGEPILGRATEIWMRRPGGWKLTHGHWSEDPDGT